MTLDHDRLRAKLGDISSSITRLQTLTNGGRDAFLQTPDNQDIARSRLLTAIEAALNICFHLCAKQLEQIPDDSARQRPLLRILRSRHLPSVGSGIARP